MGQTLVWQVHSSEKEPGRTLIQSLGSEFGERTFFIIFLFFSSFFIFFFIFIFSFFLFIFFLFFSFLFFCFFFHFFLFFSFFFLFFSYFFLLFSSFLFLFLFFSFFFFSSEFGERNRSFSELRTCRTSVPPGPFSKLRTCQTMVWPCPFSELRTCQSSEKGTGLSLNSEPAEPGFGPVLTTNSQPARVRRKELAFLRTLNPSNQDYTRSFSKLRTPGKNTILDHLARLH